MGRADFQNGSARELDMHHVVIRGGDSPDLRDRHGNHAAMIDAENGIPDAETCHCAITIRRRDGSVRRSADA